MDILAQGGLAVLRDARRSIGETTRHRVDLGALRTVEGSRKVWD
jgi:hypothetical protein